MSKNILHKAPGWLTTSVSYLHYCDHSMDNGFLEFSLTGTERNMRERGMTPLGVCLSPEYRPDMGYGLQFTDVDEETMWVHVPETFMWRWLEEVGLMPPEDVIWDREMVDMVWA